MRIIAKVLKWLLALVVVLAAGLAGWLYFAPPALIRVATAYSAKIVCSNQFIAGRDGQEVLALDVQAPGHPVLRYISIAVDRAQGTVSAKLLGLFGEARAVHRDGAGCAIVPPGEAAATPPALPASTAPDAAALWPAGERVAPSQDPALAAILDDPAMTGPGMRAVVVVHDGRIVGERYGDGFSAGTPLLGWSMTKTVTAAIIGTVVGGGGLKLDRDGLFEQWNGDERGAITIADLLAMSSGLAFNEDYGDVTDVTRMLFLEPDMAAFAGLAGPFRRSGAGLRMAALGAVRPARHGERGAGGRRARHLRRLLLSLRDGARLGALRRAPAQRRRLGGQANPARGLCRLDARGGPGLQR